MDLGQTMWKLKKSEDLASNYSKKNKRRKKGGGLGKRRDWEERTFSRTLELETEFLCWSAEDILDVIS